MANLNIPTHHSDGTLTNFVSMVKVGLHLYGTEQVKKELYFNYLVDPPKKGSRYKRFALLDIRGQSRGAADLWYTGRNIVFVSEGKSFAPNCKAEIMYIEMYLGKSKPYIVLRPHIGKGKQQYITTRAALCDFAQAAGYKDLEQLAQEHPPRNGFAATKRVLVSWTGLDFLLPNTGKQAPNPAGTLFS